MTAAAFKAEFTDIKLIRTRKVMQVIFEVPIEDATAALNALGGMPDPGASRWCAIARLNENAAAPSPDKPKHITNDKPSTSWHQLSAAQQAGILCNEPAFLRFLKDTRWDIFDGTRDVAETPEEHAAAIVRVICMIKSRAELAHLPTSRSTWERLVSEYRAWQRVPEVVG